MIFYDNNQVLLYLQESSSTPPDSALTPRWSHMQTKEFHEHVCVLHVLNALPNILYKRRAIPNLIPFAMKKLGSWSLYTYLLKVKTIFEHHITHFSKYSFEGVILDIRHLPITVFFHGHISQTKMSSGLGGCKLSAAFGAEISSPWGADGEDERWMLIGGYDNLGLVMWPPLGLSLSNLSCSSLYNSSRTASGTSL